MVRCDVLTRVLHLDVFILTRTAVMTISAGVAHALSSTASIMTVLSCTSCRGVVVAFAAV